ncbi:MAG: bacillithiol biosynthesis deacetylase BshB1 [Bacteroidota bacterium]
MKVDILAIGAHPDDIELSCSGTLLKHIDLGYTVGLLDLTRGEMGTRGTPELRLEEAENARKMMGAKFRKNLSMADGFFKNSKENQLKIIEIIREHQPDIVFANALNDRHIDHGKGAKVVADACFLSGLQKIETKGSDGKAQERWRPKAIYHYIQDRQLTPDLVVDISDYMERKIELILAFRSQFFDPDSNELETPLTGSDFFDLIKGKNKAFGRDASYSYAEGFNVTRTIGVRDLVKLD